MGMWFAFKAVNDQELAGLICAGVVVLIVFSVLLALGLMFISRSRLRKRNESLRSFAAANGWICPENTDVIDFPNHEQYELFKDGRSKQITFLMHKPVGGGQVLVFDYRFTVSSGKHTFHYYQTVVGFHAQRIQLPYFALYRETVASRIGEVFGYRDIDFSSHPYFSKRFKLRGHDEVHIRQVFHPRLLTQLEQLPDVRMDAGGNYLFSYSFDETATPENLSSFINERAKFLTLFQH